MNDKYGFTLIELLLSICIIGLIAALSIPALINNSNNKQNIAKLRTSYDNFQSAVKSMIQDEDKFPNYQGSSDINYPIGFGYYDAKKESPNVTTSNFCKELAKKLNTTGTINCSRNDVENGIKAYYDNIDATVPEPTFTTTDGVNWLVDVNTSICGMHDSACDDHRNDTSLQSSYLYAHYGVMDYIEIIIDTNGFSNAPNNTDLGEKSDQFKFYVFYNGKISVDVSTAEFLNLQKNLVK